MYAHLQTTPSTTSFPGLLHSTWAERDEGLIHLSVWRQSIAPGSATPPHRHDCDEIVMCTAGNGELHIDGVVHHFSAGSTVTLPGNVMHQISSAGDEAMEIVGVLAATPVEVFLSDSNKIDLPWRT